MVSEDTSAANVALFYQTRERERSKERSMAGVNETKLRQSHCPMLPLISQTSKMYSCRNRKTFVQSEGGLFYENSLLVLFDGAQDQTHLNFCTKHI